MKAILDKKVKKISLSYYTNYLPTGKKIHLNGMIWLEGDYNIIIRKGKFFLQGKNGKSHGIILKGAKSHTKIKRTIGIWSKKYRINGAFNGETSYWQSRCIDGMHNVNIFKSMKLPFSENKSNFLQLAM